MNNFNFIYLCNKHPVNLIINKIYRVQSINYPWWFTQSGHSIIVISEVKIRYHDIFTHKLKT